MGCNCGDNEFNIEIENNGSCEPTTPIYNISLGNVGVSGFSPKVNFVNETTSGFQIQTIDINGEELSGVVPKLSYINDTFLTINNAAETYLTQADAGNIYLTQANAATTYLTVNGSNAANIFNIGNLRVRNTTQAWITIDAINGKDLLIYNGNSKAYYGLTKSTYTEIATIGDISDLSNTLAPVATSGNYEDLSNKPVIPTVGNGTITLTQGGVTKGTFTTNQSGNTTIDLDAGGGGGSVSNPIVFTESSTDGTRTTTGTLTLGLETTGDINPALKIHYDIVDSGQGGGGSFSWDEYLIDRTLPATNGGLIATTNSSSGRYIRNMSVNVDNSTIKINSSGQLYADITVPTYTAGDAIDITSNVIGVKVDGTSITLNQNGELQSSGGVPSVIDGGNA